ncbi:PGPGW domain-containing protein [Roseomonas xinghualingensis]|uniref:PGPGW domain-containing protein n=1 Tax=Roseomonas xinghualingensis TaxID=2986475 RepID=UPI0021F0A579|nr:PGPGW domain-containing protein [Roseomonas sp. SXEYE001]MCV4207018.1 hypothetical protein [Roseomonas sp. SXEYE001]
MTEMRPAYVTLSPRPRRKALGWSFITLGILGCVLPFLQGFLFLALGVFVLRDQYLWAANRWAWVEGRWPNAIHRIEALERSSLERISGWGRGIRRTFRRN